MLAISSTGADQAAAEELEFFWATEMIDESRSDGGRRGSIRVNTLIGGTLALNQHLWEDMSQVAKNAYGERSLLVVRLRIGGITL